MKPQWLPAIALVTASLMLGCASNGNTDPLEPFNRKVHTVNDALDRAILRPVAKAYTRAAPEPVERGVHNFFVNLRYPTVVINQFLQGKGRTGLRDLARFLANSTIGLGGLFDVAGRWGLERNEEDFGQTLAVWGVGRGVYLVVPLWGPSTLRDGIGDIAGLFSSPVYHVDNDAASWTLRALGGLDSRAQLLGTESLISGDRYLFLRDAYLQRRAYLINDEVVDSDPFLDEEFE